MTRDVWQHVEFREDPADDLAGFYVDGVGSMLASSSAPTNQFFMYMGPGVENPSQGPLYIDDFSVTVGNTVVFSDNFDEYISTGPTKFVWKGAASSDWSTSGNWDVNAVPNAAGASVIFGRPGATGTADLAAAAITVGTMTFAGDVSTTIIASGSGSLTLDNGANMAAIKAAGSHAINVPLTLNSDAAINVTESDGVLTLGGVVSGTSGIIKTGIGAVSLTQANTYNGATTLECSGPATASKKPAIRGTISSSSASPAISWPASPVRTTNGRLSPQR